MTDDQARPAAFRGLRDQIGFTDTRGAGQQDRQALRDQAGENLRYFGRLHGSGTPELVEWLRPAR